MLQPLGGETQAALATLEVGRPKLPQIEQPQGQPVDHRLAERLHDVQGQRLAAVAQAVQEADRWIEAPGLERRSDLVGQDHVAEAQKRVDRVGRRVLLAPRKRHSPEHGGELPIIAGRAAPLDAADGVDRLRRLELAQCRRQTGARSAVDAVRMVTGETAHQALLDGELRGR